MSINRFRNRNVQAFWSRPFALALALFAPLALQAFETWKPNHPPSVDREKVFAFTSKPAIKNLGNDKYEITFAVKGNCDVTVAMVDGKGKVIRHLGSGVLGSNAPKPFQKNARKQTLYWDGKDDLLVYVKEPEKLKVRVSLGLNPTFEKRLGGTSPYNLVGTVWGLATGPKGVYVVTAHGKGGKHYIREFDHEGKYLKTVMPPPANLKESQLKGYGFVEYEPGKKAVHARNLESAIDNCGSFLTFPTGLAGDCQPVVSGDRLYFTDGGLYGPHPPNPTSLFSVHTDGSMDNLGAGGQVISPIGNTRFPRLAASPDGKWVYLAVGWQGRQAQPIVFRASVDGKTKPGPFLGKFTVKNGKLRAGVGSDNKSFQMVTGIDCDAKGRIYVADPPNNRIQVFSQKGDYLKTIKIGWPRLIQVHKKTGAIYVLHKGKSKGKSGDRLTKLKSFDNPKEEFHTDEFSAALFALDSWSKKPMIWTGGTSTRKREQGYMPGRMDFKGVQVYEESGGKLKKIMDFQELGRKIDGDQYLGRWQGSVYMKVVCDPNRDQVYFGRGFRQTISGPVVVDLNTGKYLGHHALPRGVDDLIFDKRGYMHCHLNPGSLSGVGRLDPSRRKKTTTSQRSAPGDVLKPVIYVYEEVPYDYGVFPQKEKTSWKALIPVKDQPGAKHFQDGIGVNMRGDIAEQCNIYYVPKMGKAGYALAEAAAIERGKVGLYVDRTNSYDHFMKTIQARQKKGEEFYFIPRKPGIPLAGATVWTFNSTGELRDECAAIAGDIINGVQIDEDGYLYFVNARIRTRDDKGTAFLAGKGGRFNEKTTNRDQRNPMTGTLMKSRPKGAEVLWAAAPVPMAPFPSRAPDMISTGFAKDKYVKTTWCWTKGVEWLYAGVTPIVFTGCSCPTMRFHTDWFKRTFVPEAYRHSIGVVDTNGNLILHIGQYGNLDSGDGPKSKIPVGGDGISVMMPRFISGTDDRLVFLDRQTRLVVLKLGYHAEATAQVRKAPSRN